MRLGKTIAIAVVAAVVAATGTGCCSWATKHCVPKHCAAFTSKCPDPPPGPLPPIKISPRKSAPLLFQVSGVNQSENGLLGGLLRADFFGVTVSTFKCQRLDPPVLVDITQAWTQGAPGGAELRIEKTDWNTVKWIWSLGGVQILLSPDTQATGATVPRELFNLAPSKIMGKLTSGETVECTSIELVVMM